MAHTHAQSIRLEDTSAKGWRTRAEVLRKQAQTAAQNQTRPAPVTVHLALTAQSPVLLTLSPVGNSWLWEGSSTHSLSRSFSSSSGPDIAEGVTLGASLLWAVKWVISIFWRLNEIVWMKAQPLGPKGVRLHQQDGEPHLPAGTGQALRGGESIKREKVSSIQPLPWLL